MRPMPRRQFSKVLYVVTLFQIYEGTESPEFVSWLEGAAATPPATAATSEQKRPIIGGKESYYRGREGAEPELGPQSGAASVTTHQGGSVLTHEPWWTAQLAAYNGGCGDEMGADVREIVSWPPSRARRVTGTGVAGECSHKSRKVSI
jgi:hypothetical protein